MAQNINYTGLTYDDIKSDIMSRLAEDSRFSNFRESALYAVITEIFAATTDFTNYYMERRAEESFLDSAQLRSSVILLSKMLGYVVRRPIPASTSIQILLKSLPQGISVGQTFQIPSGTTFTFEGKPYTLFQTLTYTVTQADINNFQTAGYTKTFNLVATDKVYNGQIFDDSDSRSVSPIKLYQCETIVKEISNTTNNQMGKRFQTYKINDPEFSNFYGSEDFGYNSSNTELNDITLNGTRVAIGTSKKTAFCTNKDQFDNPGMREFFIDRRSFLNSDTIPLLSANGAGANVKCCVIRTAMDGGVELLFGDDNVSCIGAKNNQNIYVSYLATEGATANTVGVIGKSIQCDKSSYENGFDKKNVEFYLNSNITGGSDLEDLDSIKVNAPEIFYSLDRCVTPRDYVSFLKTLVLSSKVVKNAIAWGEQEETRDNYGLANIKLFNVVLFCVLSDMYKKTSDSTLGNIYTGIDSESNVLVAPLTATEFDWFNTIVLSDSSTPLKNIKVNSSTLSDLSNVYDKLYERSQLTVKNVYVSPIIQDFDISGTIYFNPLIDKDMTKKKINDAIYSHLSLNADFNTPIYISTIIDIVESFSEVHHADIFFVPSIDNTKETFTLTTSGNEYNPTGFDKLDIGYVYSTSWTSKSKYGTREYSRYPVSTCDTIVRNIMLSNSESMAISAYDSSTLDAIFCMAPNFEVKSYKSDKDFITSTLIWPSSNQYDKNTCSIVTSVTTSSDIYNNYTPSERNLYLGVAKCFVDNLNAASKDTFTVLDDVIRKYDESLQNGKCFCSLKDYIKNQNDKTSVSECTKNIQNANKNMLIEFVDKYLFTYVTILRNTFSEEIRKNMIDAKGNISNFSMRNEIARVKLDNLTYSYK